MLWKPSKTVLLSDIPALMILAVLSCQGAWAADINRRTSIICISQDSRSLISVPGDHTGDSNSEKTIGSFTQWMFEAEKEPAPSEIRFLWIPYSPTNASQLKIADADHNHSVILLLSQTRHGVLAATSNSGRLTNVGWMFAINFKAEQVVGTQIFSNLGGARGRTFNYSCHFNDHVSGANRNGGDGTGD